MGLLAGKTALITGAGRGIGRATAIMFAEEGANIAICSRTESELAETAEMCEKQGAKVYYKVADVRNYEEMQQFIEESAEKFEQIHIAVSNAGIAKDNIFLRMTPEDFEATIDTNLKGAFNFAQPVVKHFRKFREGRLIFVSSLVGLRGNPGQSNYSASKSS